MTHPKPIFCRTFSRDFIFESFSSRNAKTQNMIPLVQSNNFRPYLEHLNWVLRWPTLKIFDSNEKIEFENLEYKKWSSVWRIWDNFVTDFVTTLFHWISYGSSKNKDLESLLWNLFRDRDLNFENSKNSNFLLGGQRGELLRFAFKRSKPESPWPKCWTFTLKLHERCTSALFQKSFLTSPAKILRL